MKKKLTPSERVTAVLHGRETDRVPFTVYESLIREEQRRPLYPLGLCIVNRVCSYEIVYGCRIEEGAMSRNEGDRVIVYYAYSQENAVYYPLEVRAAE